MGYNTLHTRHAMPASCRKLINVRHKTVHTGTSKGITGHTLSPTHSMCFSTIGQARAGQGLTRARKGKRQKVKRVSFRGGRTVLNSYITHCLSLGLPSFLSRVNPFPHKTPLKRIAPWYIKIKKLEIKEMSASDIKKVANVLKRII